MITEELPEHLVEVYDFRLERRWRKPGAKGPCPDPDKILEKDIYAILAHLRGAGEPGMYESVMQEITDLTGDKKKYSTVRSAYDKSPLRDVKKKPR